jgi:hypothetical protein
VPRVDLTRPEACPSSGLVPASCGYATKRWPARRGSILIRLAPPGLLDRSRWNAMARAGTFEDLINAAAGHEEPWNSRHDRNEPVGLS